MDQNDLEHIVRRGMNSRGWSWLDLALAMQHGKPEAILRRLARAFAGHPGAASSLKDALCQALPLEAEPIDAAVSRMCEVKAVPLEPEPFRREIMFTTVNRIPQPIFVAAVLGGPRRLLRRPIPDDWSDDEVPTRFAAVLPDKVPAFGAVTGFVALVAPGRALVCDRAGQVIGEREDLPPPGSVTLRVGSGTWVERT